MSEHKHEDTAHASHAPAAPVPTNPGGVKAPNPDPKTPAPEPKPPTKPAPKPKPDDPLVGEALALRAKVEKFVKDDGEFAKLRDEHADLAARAQDSTSKTTFAAVMGILDVVSGDLARVAPRT